MPEGQKLLYLLFYFTYLLTVLLYLLPKLLYLLFYFTYCQSKATLLTARRPEATLLTVQ